MENKLVIARIALLALASVASVSALNKQVNRGDYCPSDNDFPGSGNGDWPASWDKCPDSQHSSTSLSDDCCVAKCMSTLLNWDNDKTFTVCVPDSEGGSELATSSSFDWSEHYCDCPFKDYCHFVCHPDCDLPLVSRFNQVKGELNSFTIAGRKNNTEAEEDAYKIELRHDSRNLCPVFFFAIFRTPNQIVIDWTLSVLYKPWAVEGGEAHVCEEIIIDFAKDLNGNKPQCFTSDDHYINNVQCGLQLPTWFDGRQGSSGSDTTSDVSTTRAEYIAYSTCEFKSVKVLEKVCYH